MRTTSLHLYNTSEFYIKTPMSEALHNTIQEWLWCGFTGGLILGESRTGKSRAIRALDVSLPSRNDQPVPIHRVIFGDRDNKTIREAWVKIAKSTGMTSISRTSSAEDLSSQVAFYLTEAALQNDTHQVILIIDEAQFLSINQLSVFAELHNLLDEARINIMMLFVANQDMFGKMAANLIEPENKYIRERFFNNLYLFYGIRKATELNECFMALDGDSKCPLQVSITESCAPNAYQDGFRLSQTTELVWELYCEEYRSYSSSKSWGMEYFTRFVKIFLLDYLPVHDYRCADNLTVMISNSLKASGIKSMLGDMYASKQRQ